MTTLPFLYLFGTTVGLANMKTNGMKSPNNVVVLFQITKGMLLQRVSTNSSILKNTNLNKSQMNPSKYSKNLMVLWVSCFGFKENGFYRPKVLSYLNSPLGQNKSLNPNITMNHYQRGIQIQQKLYILRIGLYVITKVMSLLLFYL